MENGKEKRRKRLSCPYGKHCFTDDTVCGEIGYYAECPITLKEKIYTEIKEGAYGGVEPHALLLRRTKKEVINRLSQ